MTRFAVQATPNLRRSLNVAGLLLAAGVCALPGVATALPAESTPPPVLVLPIAGMRPSHCRLPEPASGLRKSYPAATARGVYRAYGDAGLLPLRMQVEIGDAKPTLPIGQFLFGASTTFDMPTGVDLPDGPNPVSNLGVPKRPMAGVYHPTVDPSPDGLSQSYRLEMTASAWEITGQKRAGHLPPVACLYFRGQPTHALHRSP